MVYEFFLLLIMSHPYQLMFSKDGHLAIKITRILLSKASESTFQPDSVRQR